MAHPQGDTRDEHGNALDIQAIHVGQRVVRERAARHRRTSLLGERRHPVLQLKLETAQFAVRDIEEVATPAGRVEHTEGTQLIKQVSCFCRCLGRRDALPPRPHNRWRDDLHDVRLVRVVGAELVATFLTQHTLHEGTKNRGVDRAPVKFRSPTKVLEFASIHENGRRMFEKLTVHIPGALVTPLPIVVALLVEQRKQVADIARRIRLLLLQQCVNGVLQRVAVQHPQIFSEQAPHHLHREALDFVRWGSGPVGQRVIESRDVGRCLRSKLAPVLRKHRFDRFGLEEKE